MITPQIHQRPDRGAAVVEFAFAAILLLALLGGMIDFGFALNNTRHAESTARSAARTAAAGSESRLADYAAIRTVHAAYAGRSEDLVWMTVYRSRPGTNGEIPAGCGNGSAGVSGLCNTYSPAQVSSLTEADFSQADCSGDPDSLWCPTTRDTIDAAGDLLGVAVWAESGSIIGVGPASGVVREHAVFRLETPE